MNEEAGFSPGKRESGAMRFGTTGGAVFELSPAGQRPQAGG